jgi:hypothetical protein
MDIQTFESAAEVKNVMIMIIMTGSLDDPQKAVNVSLWESREDMDNYYANDKEYDSFLESLKPLIEQEIEKSDYTVFKLNFIK